MTQPTTNKDAIAQAATNLADFLGGKYGNPLDIDAEDRGRLQEMLTQIGTHLEVCEARDLLRAQAPALQDVDATVQQIAADVARLQDIQKQNPALLHASLDALHASWQQMDLLLEPYARTFADMVRRSRSALTQERQ
jgi:hypothetical protein